MSDKIKRLVISGALLPLALLPFAGCNLTSAPAGGAQVIPSVSASSTASTNPQTLYTQVTSHQPAISDPLTGQSGLDWETRTNADGSRCLFSGNALHMLTSNSQNVIWCLEHAMSLDNFAAQVQMTMLRGMDQSGVVFRASTNEYIFNITPGGRYALTRWEGKSNTGTVLAMDHSQLIVQGAGQTNELAVIARGPTIDLYLNGHFVAEVHDSGSQLGWFGFIGNSGAGASGEVAYSQLQCWSL